MHIQDKIGRDQAKILLAMFQEGDFTTEKLEIIKNSTLYKFFVGKSNHYLGGRVTRNYSTGKILLPMELEELYLEGMIDSDQRQDLLSMVNSEDDYELAEVFINTLRNERLKKKQ